MIEKLRIKAVYEDFLKNVTLTKEQTKILDMLINKDSVVKISMEVGMSQRNVGYEIRKLKDLYRDYYDMQLYRVMLLLD